MSVYSLVGLDLPISSLLLKQASALKIFNTTKESFCNVCKKTKSQQLFILINNRFVGSEQENLYLICSQCRLRKNKAKGESFVAYKTLLKVLTILSESSLTKEALPLVDKIVNNLKEKFKKADGDPRQIIQEISLKLVGRGWQEADTLEYEKSPKRIWQLIQEFYNDLSRSYVARYYRGITAGDFKLEGTSPVLLKHFCKRQTNFKLGILNQMVSISQRINDVTDLSNWLRKGLEGINQFEFAFAAIIYNRENTLFSICRKSVQYRYIYDHYNPQIKSELILTEFPMNERPFVFRVTSFGYEDQVEIGLYYASKNEVQGPYLQANTPLLFRFKVAVKYHEHQAAEHNLIDSTGSQDNSNVKKRFKSTNKDKSQEKKKEPYFKKKKEQIIQIDDKDVLKIHFDYKTEVFTIFNKTKAEKLVQCNIKAGYSARYFIFPCIRLIGVKIMVESLIK